MDDPPGFDAMNRFTSRCGGRFGLELVDICNPHGVLFARGITIAHVPGNSSQPIALFHF
jgi:hypothetical protein